MFDLPDATSPPTDFDALRDALEQSARRRVEVANDQVVTVEGGDWPDGRRLAVDLTGGRVVVDADRRDELKPPTMAGDHEAGPTFAEFSAKASPLVADVADGGQLPITLDVTGHDVAFEFGRSDRGELVMAPAGGTATARVSVPRGDLLAVVEQKARAEAAKQGVKIDRVTADVSSPTPRSLSITGEGGGSKKVAFFNAGFTVRFAADVAVEADDAGELVGRFTRLEVAGDGPVMNVVLGLIRPKIEEIKSRPLPLGDALAAAGVRGLAVRDVTVEAGDNLTLTVDLAGRAA